MTTIDVRYEVGAEELLGGDDDALLELTWPTGPELATLLNETHVPPDSPPVALRSPEPSTHVAEAPRALAAPRIIELIEPPSGPPPGLLARWGPSSLVAAMVLVIAVIQLVVGALEIGPTIDEPVHVKRTRSWLQTGWYVPDAYMKDGNPDPTTPMSSPYVYGPAYSALAHTANVLAGNEAIDEVSESREAYSVRHLTTAALGLLAAIAVGLIVWTLTGSRVFGLWGTAGLLAVPAWLGQSFFSVKDVPAAVGYTFLTAGIVLALGGGQDRMTLTRRAAIALLIAAGFCIGVGTRPSFLVPFAGTLAVFAVFSVARSILGRLPGRAGLGAVALGAVVGLASIGALYPNAVTEPWTFVQHSLTDATDYAWEGVTLTAGELLSERPPWWYLPAWIFGSHPVALMLLSILGAVAGLRRLLRRSVGGPIYRSVWSRRELGVVFVLLQAALLTTGAAAMSSVMYTGIRQHLYVVPALAALAGVGAHAMWRWVTRRRASRWLPSTAAAVLVLSLAVPLAEQMLLFPYNYTYINEVAGIGGVSDRWETDYFFASAGEALRRVPRDAHVRCTFRMVMPGEDPADPSLVKCSGARFDPIIGGLGTNAIDRSAGTKSGVWVVGRIRGGNRAPSFCYGVEDVTRRMRFERVVMAKILNCDAEGVRAADELRAERKRRDAG